MIQDYKNILNLDFSRAEVLKLFLKLLIVLARTEVLHCRTIRMLLYLVLLKYQATCFGSCISHRQLGVILTDKIHLEFKFCCLINHVYVTENDETIFQGKLHANDIMFSTFFSPEP